MPTYIIRAGASGPVKIGWAEDVPARLAHLQTGHYEVLSLVREIDTAWRSERAFHRRFADYRLRGEWFFFCAEMLTFVPEERDDSRSRIKAETKAALVEAQDHIKRLIGNPSWDESRPQMIGRAAEAAGLPANRVACLFYGKSRIVHSYELDALRRAGGEMPAGAGAAAAAGIAIARLAQSEDGPLND